MSRRAYSALIFALFADALAVFIMQSVRWRGAWIFVVLYWAILLAKNAIDYWNNYTDERMKQHDKHGSKD